MIRCRCRDGRWVLQVEDFVFDVFLLYLRALLNAPARFDSQSATDYHLHGTRRAHISSHAHM